MIRIIHPLAAFLGLTLVASAYPPAPPHTIYGTVRDEYGNPFAGSNARIEFIDGSGMKHVGTIDREIGSGVNYEISIPMDAGNTPDLYRPSALRQLAPFRIQVIVGNNTYLPIEMQGEMRLLGQPAERTRINLTLGTDSDGDGLPDAWKDMVIAMMGGELTRADITPDGDLDKNGMTNMQEYIAGTYPWDPNDRLWLEIVEILPGPRPALEFMAIEGRDYVILRSTDLINWSPVRFELPGSGEIHEYFPAKSFHQRLRVVAEATGEANPGAFYMLQVR